MSGVVFALVLYVFPDCFSCGVLTDGVDVKTARPEPSSPQHPFDLRVALEYLLCSNAFDGSNDLAGRCCRDRLDEKVDVVLVGADLDEVDVIAVLYFKADGSECFDDTVAQYFPAVLDGEYRVVEQTRLVVALLDMPIFHARNIS